jgi:tetratricopeptide (TPR) repeat protein
VQTSRQPAGNHRRPAGRQWVLRASLCCLLAPLVGCGGCTGSATSPGPGRRSAAETASQWQDERLHSIEYLNRLEEFDSGETLHEVFRRLNKPDQPSAAAPEEKMDPLRATWPEPEMLRQIIDRLNQWVRSQAPPDWTPDPLLATLPQPLRQLPMVEDLGKMEFSGYDGFALLEAAWLRDVSNWAHGDELDELGRAQNLFDWTVRNIQLEPAAAAGAQNSQNSGGIPQVPWETLFFGRGTALERAWVFILLARQQELEAVLLALADPADPAGKPPRPWAVALLSEGKLYLFEPALGLPIPAADGVKLDSAEQLVIQPATLAEVAVDETLLRKLDLDPAHPYPVKASDLKQVVALVEASPACLARRMKLVESRLVGQQKMVLTAAASAQAERLEAVPGIAAVRLWTLPYETLQRRLQLGPEAVRRRLEALLPFYVSFYAAVTAPLHKGRLLYLKGQFTGQQGATQYLQAARPSNQELADLEKKTANAIYEMAVPRIEKLPLDQQPAARKEAETEAAAEAAVQTALLLRAKHDASYWLGLLAFQRANYSSAIDYFARRTLEVMPDGPWTSGAMYNLARCYEATGQWTDAGELYQSDPDSPGYHGNLLRARWLASLKK